MLFKWRRELRASLPGNGKTKTGRLWTYVRDDRPAGDLTPPAVWFAYSQTASESIRKHTWPSSRACCRLTLMPVMLRRNLC